MKGITLLVSMLALIFSAQAQDFQPGSIVISGEEKLEGLVRSDFLPGDAQIFYKESDGATEQVFASDNVDKVVLTVKGNINITFTRERILESYGRASEKVWLQQLIDGPISLYADTGRDYLLYNNGNFMQLDRDVSFYLKRSSDEAATLGGTFRESAFNVTADRNFVKLTSDFLSDNTTLSDRIRDREFGILELPMVVDIYNAAARDKTLP